MKLRVLVPIVILLQSAISKAETEICRTQVISSTCGSGQIEFIFDKSSNQFQFHNGDVHCWSDDYFTKGTLKKGSKKYPHYLEGTYELFITRAGDPQPANLGSLFYDDIHHLAKIELSSAIVTATLERSYNLYCEPSKNDHIEFAINAAPQYCGDTLCPPDHRCTVSWGQEAPIFRCEKVTVEHPIECK